MVAVAVEWVGARFWLGVGMFIWLGISPALGGGGMLDVAVAVDEGGTGTAPGCGAGGPSLPDEACVVRVGCGCAKGVGAGTDAAPGCAAAYAGAPLPAAAVVTPESVFDVLVGSCSEVCGVTPVGLLGVIGSSMWTGMGGIVSQSC